MVQTKQKDKIRKIAVDLGQADRLKLDIKKGSTLTFTGFPVKVMDRPVMMARSIQTEDRVILVHRHVDRKVTRK